MSFPVLLDVAIGMSFVFLTLSAIASTANEIIATWLRLRAKFLEQGIIHLLCDGDFSLALDVINHPLLRQLTPDFKHFPAYIPSADFVVTLIEGLRKRAPDADARITALKNEVNKITDQNVKQPILDALNAAGTNPDQARRAAANAIAHVQDPALRDSLINTLEQLNLEEIKQGILAVPDERIRNVLLTLFNAAMEKEQTLASMKDRLDGWFNSNMDLVSSLYRQNVQRILLVLGIAICVIFNADALQIFNTLWHDPTIRAAVVAQASAQQTPPAPNAGDATSALKEEVAKASNLPIGWTCTTYNDITRSGWKYAPTPAPSAAPAPTGNPTVAPIFPICVEVNAQPIEGGSFSPSALLLKILGLSLMAGGISFGAPFWFGVINKLVPLRADKPKS